MFKKIIMTLMGIAFTPLFALAAPISYTINHSINAFGTVTGTIETDGTIGILNSINILDWNLTINADADTSTVGHLLGPKSGNNSSMLIYPESALSTSVVGQNSMLYIDFGGSSRSFQIRTSDYDVVWQAQSGIPFQDELFREGHISFNPIQTYEFHGPVSYQIGTASIVPEMSTNGLMFAGFVILALMTRRKVAY